MSWEEVREGKVRPGDFTIQTIRDRLMNRDDLFRAIRERPQQLSKRAGQE